MDSWPYDDRLADTTYKGKEKKVVGYDHPYLQQGMVGAVTLTERDYRLEWSFLRAQSNQDSTRRWRLGELFKVFPETRPPLPPKSHFGTKLSAQHGANFIRTCMPDADIPAELIREQLEEEDVRTIQLQEFDPYTGNLLVFGIQQIPTNTATGFLAFPMGEVLSDLNISTLAISRTEVTVKPVAHYKRALPTPIQQIATAPLGKVHALAVRVYDSTELFLLNKSDTQSTWSVESVGKITLADTNRREVVDFRLGSEQAVMVNEHGSLYTSCPFSSKPQVTRLSDMSADDGGKDPYFWRLAFDQDSSSGYVISSDNLSIFDMRTGDHARRYFELKTRNDFLTSVEDCGSDGIVRLCSTNQILWLDRRNMRSPLLSVRHYRQFDRYLSTKTLGGACTFLTSRRNNMISIYEVSHFQDQLLHIRNEPFGVFPRFSTSDCIGQTFVTSPFLNEGSNAVILKLSNRGSISGCSILSNDVEDDLNIVVKYTTALQSMESQSWKSTELLVEQEHTVINMVPAYDAIFRKHDEKLEKVEEKEAPLVYDLLEQIPTYFQHSDIPSGQMLTTYDVAFRAGNEPKVPSRSDFLTGNVLNSQRGHHALRQGRLDPNSFVSKAPWHMDLGPTLSRFGLVDGVSDDAKRSEEPFCQFNLQDDGKRAAASMRLEKRHREQLEVDLRLSRDVFSMHSFAKPSDVDQTLETMTEALSLGGAPPEVDFDFLRPMRQLGLGMGVKLLLKDWEIGTNASDYTYQDLYNTVGSRPIRALPRAVANEPPPTATAAPPQLLTQKELGVNQPSVPARTFVQTEHSQHQSQDVAMASTQILAGAFGGRVTKKKTEKKKRLGGF